jgi:hypothetical protein
MARLDDIKRTDINGGGSVGNSLGTFTPTTPMSNDGRLTQADANDVVTNGNADLKASNDMYDGMIEQNNTNLTNTLDMINTNEQSQKDIVNANTDFTLDKIEQEKNQAHNDYITEQSGAYTDYQKASNPYGVNAERMASNGLTNSGYSESSQVAMYVAYQNRVAIARDSYQRAMVDYNNAMTEAKLSNNSLLAEIAANALEKRMEAIVNFTQYGNTLLTQKADAAYKIKQTTHTNWMDALKLLEEQNQFDRTMAEQQRQFNEDMAYKYSALNKTSTGGSYSGKGENSGNDYTGDKTNATFTGTTYSDATKFIKEHGGDASSLMTQGEWQRHKNSGSNNAHTSYNTYAEYLKDYVSYAIGE